ncbi:MAG TPA: ChuX/HutX family heme-like substrate-binding protein [Nitrosopumilus sp.]|nr:ChuX/HutX family heme-like substrate-binding protein [Nitrosopumilus sp.]HJM25599.1 ChuX/HutX family heme-like substrate-binding protein [Nitrosopumilus sp.]HJO32115.1 ChuX/HutX family heme-like substrate-binding protein [Nitrosopumilus sp.]
MLFELLSDLVKIENILFIVRNSGVVSEIRNNSFSIKQKEKWITIGDNDDPAHMHIDSELITSAEFVKEIKPECTSFNVIFFNENEERVLTAFFTKIYDETKTLLSERTKIYVQLNQKYSSKVNF